MENISDPTPFCVPPAPLFSRTACAPVSPPRHGCWIGALCKSWVLGQGGASLKPGVSTVLTVHAVLGFWWSTRDVIFRISSRNLMLSFLFHKYIIWIMESSPVLKAVLGVCRLATFFPLVAIVAAFSYCPVEAGAAWEHLCCSTTGTGSSTRVMMQWLLSSTWESLPCR